MTNYLSWFIAAFVCATYNHPIMWHLPVDYAPNLPDITECPIIGYNMDSNIGYYIGGYGLYGIYSFRLNTVNDSYNVSNGFELISMAETSYIDGIYSCNGPGYVMTNNVIYWVSFNDSTYIHLNMFDMKDERILLDVNRFPNDNDICDINSNPCLLTNGEYIYLLCQSNAYYFDLNGKRFSYINQTEYDHTNGTCVWYNDIIVSISGIHTNKIEYLSNYIWYTCSKELPNSISNSLAYFIESRNVIYLFGGIIDSKVIDYGYYISIQNIIDISGNNHIQINSINVSQDLILSDANMGSIYFDSRIFIFGGLNNDLSPINTWYFTDKLDPPITTQTPTNNDSDIIIKYIGIGLVGIAGCIILIYIIRLFIKDSKSNNNNSNHNNLLPYNGSVNTSNLNVNNIVFSGRLDDEININNIIYKTWNDEDIVNFD